MGTQHPHRKRKTAGLDGSHDRSVDRSVHRCDPRNDSFGRIASLLSRFHERRAVEIRPFRENVWDVDCAGKNDEKIAEEGLQAMENWMKELGLCLHIAELGVTEEMFEGIAKGTFLINSGYHKFTKDEIVQILKESMR